MTTNHTPGPWHVGSNHGQLFIHNDHATREPICNLDTGAHDADADLIAAAPDLLAALQAYHSEHFPGTGTTAEAVKDRALHAMAAAAIAKAVQS